MSTPRRTNKVVTDLRKKGETLHEDSFTDGPGSPTRANPNSRKRPRSVTPPGTEGLEVVGPPPEEKIFRWIPPTVAPLEGSEVERPVEGDVGLKMPVAHLEFGHLESGQQTTRDPYRLFTRDQLRLSAQCATTIK